MIRRFISKSVSSKLNLPFGVLFVFVLVGLILFANSSRFTAYQLGELHEQGEHIRKVHRMHASTYHLILSIHHFLITKEPQFVSVFNDQLNELNRLTEDYIKGEKKETYPEAEKEIEIMKKIQEKVSRLRFKSVELFRSFIGLGTIDPELMNDVESEAYGIELDIKRINDIHWRMIDKLSSGSTSRVAFLLRLYLIYILLGAILLILVNMVAFRYVISPLRKLARATEDLAGGDLKRRVDVDSGDEVGALARAFNEMAERLETHDREHHDFSQELERKVRERTRELERTTEHLRATQARLVRTEQQAAVGRLAAGVAHEIRTPLNSLAINLQIVRRQLQERKGAGDSSILEAFSAADLEVGRMNRVLEEFVAYARFPEPKPKRVDINAVIRQVADFLTPEASEKGSTFEVNLHPGLAPLEADEEQFRQVLINLCINAIQAMPQGGAVAIDTEPVNHPEDGWQGVLIRIADQGEGIPSDALKKIFEPFYSTKPDGLGLGLAIVARIVDQHNGQIFCRSEVGRGTTFEVLLPKVQGIVGSASPEKE